MSRVKIRNLNELKDSRLLYEKDLPPFGYIIIALVSILFIAVIIWSVYTPKTYVVKSSGTIQSDNKNYVMPAYSGEISGMCIKEGSYVETGDLLFTIKSTDLDLQGEQLVGQIEIYNEKIKQLKKLEQSIINGANYFDASSEIDRQYYNQYEAYISQVEQNQVDTSTYKNYGYTDEQIQAELEKNTAKISEIYYSTLKTVNENVQQYEDEVKKLQVQQKAIENGQSDYQVFANTTGIVHLMSDYKEGMVVQAASVIGSIANENDEYSVIAYISVSDMPRIEIGDQVDLEVSGLSQSIYGNLSGTIKSIDNDLTTSQDGKQSYFKAEITLGNPYLISSKGSKVNISNGMAVEARIIYDELSYFNYVMEGLGILIR